MRLKKDGRLFASSALLSYSGRKCHQTSNPKPVRKTEKGLMTGSYKSILQYCQIWWKKIMYKLILP